MPPSLSEEEVVLTHDPRAVIMILSTTEADALAAKSGLSLVDLFRPFGEVDEPGVQVPGGVQLAVGRV